MRGGVSLGKYIIVNQWMPTKEIMHEYGHCRQSKYLGPLYLLVIGIPSLIWAIFGKRGDAYYTFYTEKWADKLGGVDR